MALFGERPKAKYQEEEKKKKKRTRLERHVADKRWPPSPSIAVI
jgi:hypothetical protein